MTSRAPPPSSAVLGWRFAVDEDDPRRATKIHVDGHPIGGVSDLSGPVYPPGTPPHAAYYLAVDDVDRRAEAAVAHGARLVVGPFDAGEQGRMATLVDPEGAAFSLWQARSFAGWRLPPGVEHAPMRLVLACGAPERALPCGPGRRAPFGRVRHGIGSARARAALGAGRRRPRPRRRRRPGAQARARDLRLDAGGGRAVTAAERPGRAGDPGAVHGRMTFLDRRKPRPSAAPLPGAEAHAGLRRPLGRRVECPAHTVCAERKGPGRPSGRPGPLNVVRF